MDWGEKIVDVVLAGLPKAALAAFPEDRRRQLTAKAKQYVGAGEISTNHDLIRAGRFAWIRAARLMMKAVNDIPTSEAGDIRGFGAITGEALDAIEKAAFRRDSDVSSSPIDRHLPAIMLGASELIWPGGQDDRRQRDVNESFSTDLHLLAYREPGEAPGIYGQVARQGLTSHGGHARSFGELVFAAFAEMLKSSTDYPEARRGFAIALEAVSQHMLRAANETLGRVEAAQIETLLSVQALQASLAGLDSLDLLPSIAEDTAAIRRIATEQSVKLDALKSAVDRLAAPSHDRLIWLRDAGVGPGARSDQAAIHQSRRNACRPPLFWKNVAAGLFWRRPALMARALAAFRGWRFEEEVQALRFPVFWIAGRQGDGKSVLLLQLVQELQRADPAIVGLKAGPRDLAHAVREIRRQREASPDLKFFLVVDDLNPGGDNQLKEDLAALSQTVGSVAIIACGPERDIRPFRSAMGSQFPVKEFIVEAISAEEKRDLCQWLGFDLARVRTEGDHLVAFLFELDEGMSIDDFAHRFRRRLTERGLFDQVRRAIAVNALDQPVDLALLDGVLDKFEHQLGGDQKHFGDDRFSDGEPGKRFSHNFIAWRLWHAWSDKEVAPEAALASDLAASIALYEDKPERVSALLNALATRLPDVDGRKAREFAAAAIGWLLETFKARPPLLAPMLWRSLWLASAGQIEMPDNLLRVGRRLVAAEQCPRRWRAGLAAQLLLAAARQAEADAPFFEAFARRSLIEEAGPGSAGSVAMLTTHTGAAARGWDAWGRLWLERNADHPELAVLLQRVLEKSERNGSGWAFDAATEWASARMSPPAAGTAPASEVAAGQPEADLAALEAIIALLLVKSSEPEPIRARAEGWMGSRIADVHQHLMEKIIKDAGNERATIELALRWLDLNPRDSGSLNVLRKLVKAEGRDADVAQTAMNLIDQYPPQCRPEDVVVALVRKNIGSDSVVRFACDWLARNPLSNDRHQVVCAMFDAPDFERATGEGIASFTVRFLGRPENAHASGAGHAVICLIKSDPHSATLVKLAHDWLAGNPTCNVRHQLVCAMFDAPAFKRATGEDIASFALRFLDKPENDHGSEAGQVIPKLINATKGSDESVGRALAWAEREPSNPELLQTLKTLLRSRPDRADVIDLALRWLARERDGRRRLEIVTAFLWHVGRHDAVVELAESEKAKAAGVRLLELEWALAAAALRTSPDDLHWPDRFRTLLSASSHSTGGADRDLLALQTRALALWIQASGPAGPALAFIVAAHGECRQGKLPREGLKALSAACGQFLETTLRGAAGDPRKAGALYALIAGASRLYNPDLGGELLRRAELLLPGEASAPLWVRILEDTRLPPGDGVDRLCAWLKTLRNARGVIPALRARQDIVAAARGRLPPAIAIQVRPEAAEGRAPPDGPSLFTVARSPVSS